MRRIVGEIVTYPWVEVTLKTHTGHKKVKFLVDTGFGGELAVPRSWSTTFGTAQDEFEAEFADGQREMTQFISCMVDWIDGEREATIMYIGGANPLLGMELLSDALVTLELDGTSGTITIEPNQ